MQGDQRPDQRERNTEMISVEVHHSAAEEQRHREDQQQQAARSQREERYWCWSIFIQALTFIVVTAGVCIYYRQLCSMIDAANAATTAAQQAERANALAAEELVASRRAWLGPAGIAPIRLSADKPDQYVEILVANTGGGPAKQIRSHFGLHFVSFGAQCPTGPSDHAFSGAAVLGPGQPTSLKIRVPLDGEQVGALDLQRQTLCLSLQIDYENIVGPPGSTSLCLEYAPVLEQPTFVWCEAQDMR